MAGFALNEYFEKSVEEVFEFLTDPQNAKLVAHEVRKVEASETGEVRAGTRYTETRQVRGKEVHTELEVVEIERPYRYAVAQERQGLRAVYTYSLYPEDGGTRMDLEAEVDAEGIKAALAWIVAEVLRRRDADLLMRVKEGLKKAEEEEEEGI